jgi:hypothetical protein
MRLWKSLTGDLDEIVGIEKKWKNSSVVRVDATCLKRRKCMSMTRA